MENDAFSRNELSIRKIEQDITSFVRGQHGITLDPHAGFMASGLTSNDLMALLAEIKGRWGVEVSVDSLFSGGSVTALAQHVADEVRAPGKESPMNGHVTVAPASSENGQGAVQANARRALRRNIRTALGASGE